MSTEERQAVIRKLRDFEDRLQGLMASLDGTNRLSHDAKTKAQEQMKNLKEGLKEECKLMQSISGRAQLNRYEAAYLRPAVHGASTQIKVRWNTDPTNPRWFSEIYAAHVDIAHYLHQLEAKAGGEELA